MGGAKCEIERAHQAEVPLQYNYIDNDIGLLQQNDVKPSTQKALKDAVKSS